MNNFIINCTAILCLLLYVLFFVANFWLAAVISHMFGYRFGCSPPCPWAPMALLRHVFCFGRVAKKRSWEIEVGNMNPKNNNMKCSTADWPIVNLTAGAPRCVYITFRLSGCSRSLTKKRQKIVACFLGCLLKTPAWPLTWLFSYTQHTYTPTHTYVGGLCVSVWVCVKGARYHRSLLPFVGSRHL